MSSSLHPTVADVTTRIVQRSAPGRAEYLRRIREAGGRGPSRGRLACANLAPGFAALLCGTCRLLNGSTLPSASSAANFRLYSPESSSRLPSPASPAALRARRPDPSDPGTSRW